MMSSVDKAKYVQAAALMEIPYILIASFLCILPIIADLLHGLSKRNFRFPCRFFSFTLAFVTALSVAIKPPMDPRSEQAAYTPGSMATMAFLSTLVANMLPCLGSMDSDNLKSNVRAFLFPTILVIFHFCMEVYAGVIGQVNLGCIIVAIILVLQIILISAAKTIPPIKQNLYSKYRVITERFTNDPHAEETPALRKLRQDVERYEFMLETGSPVLVVAAGTISATGLVIYTLVAADHLRKSGSGYRWCSLLTTMSIGVVVGSVAPICRCFIFMLSRFESSGR